MKQHRIPAFYGMLIKFLAIALPALLICAATARACPDCTTSQPRILRAISHGPGPDSRWDYLIALGFVIITLFTGFYSVKWLIRPGESANTHIKRFILNND